THRLDFRQSRSPRTASVRHSHWLYTVSTVALQWLVTGNLLRAFRARSSAWANAASSSSGSNWLIDDNRPSTNSTTYRNTQLYCSPSCPTASRLARVTATCGDSHRIAVFHERVESTIETSSSKVVRYSAT